MNRIVIASDSFKGTLSSVDINHICDEAIKENDFDVSLTPIPIADGGEGTLDAFECTLECVRKKLVIKDANLNDIEASYLIYKDKAIIEVAEAISLPKTKIKNPLFTSSFGVGQIIKDAIKNGVKEIVVGLGGSSTNDAGCGLLESLGVIFYDEKNQIITSLNNSKLSMIDHLDTNEFETLISNIKFTCMCDVTNPLLGKNGTTYNFAQQKGATIDDLPILENNIKHFASLFNYKNINKHGTCAAGGIGYTFLTLFKAKLVSGIDLLLNLIKFNEIIEDADIVISGEGKLDKQSFNGKVIDGISRRCSFKKKPLYLIVGQVENNDIVEKAKDKNIKKILTLNTELNNLDDAIINAKIEYKNAFIRLLKDLS